MLSTSVQSSRSASGRILERETSWKSYVIEDIYRGKYIEMEDEVTSTNTRVVIVGAGPAGLATSACLGVHSISNVVLEAEDCYAPLWKKRAYDRLKLHLGKEFCELPHMPYPPRYPTFVPRAQFIDYLDSYVAEFGINIRCSRRVVSAFYDGDAEKWRVEAKNFTSGEVEVYVAKFLVVATGENSAGIIPAMPGLDGFQGEVMHSNAFVNGRRFKDKDALVVGCGNSGMEIAHDLKNCGANASIVVRGPVHVLSKEMVLLGMKMLKDYPCDLVDTVVLALSTSQFGNLESFGIWRPTKGPFHLKASTGRSPVIDVGTLENIVNGDIKVFPSISTMKGNHIEFINGEMKRFDVLVFATGYRSTVRNWLKGGDDLIDGGGMPRKPPPNQWKGEVGLYCVGFSQRGLFGIAEEARSIANDITTAMASQAY